MMIKIQILKKVKKQDKNINKKSKPSWAKNMDKVTEDDYNFESHSSIDEDSDDTGFDFMEKFKD